MYKSKMFYTGIPKYWKDFFFENKGVIDFLSIPNPCQKRKKQNT